MTDTRPGIFSAISDLFSRICGTFGTLWRWMKVTTLIVFMPVTVLGVLVGTQTAVFTGACYLSGYACDYALSSDKVVAMYAGAMMSLSGPEEYYAPADKRRASR